MAQRIVDVLVPVALDHAYSYRAPAGARPLASAISSRCRSGRARRSAWCGPTTCRCGPGLHNRLKDVEAKLDYPPLREELRNFVDWVANYTLAPRGMVLRMALAHGRARPGARARRGAARRPAAAAHDAGAPPRARGARRRLAAHQGRGREGCRRLGRRDRRPGRRRHARSRRAAARAGRAPARSGLSRARSSPAPQRMAADILRGAVEPGRLHGRPARRRHRLRQDRSLFRGDRRDDPAGAASR